MAYRNVQEEIWKSKAFRGVSKDAKLLLFYFMTGRDTNQSGICELDHEYARFEAGLTDEEYKEAFQELEDQALIIVDHENGEFSVTDWNYHNWKSNISNFTNACKHIAKSNSNKLIQHFLDTIPLQDRKSFFKPTGRDKTGISFAGAFTQHTGLDVITDGDQLLFIHRTPSVDRRLTVGLTEAEAEAETEEEAEPKAEAEEEKKKEKKQSLELGGEYERGEEGLPQGSSTVDKKGQSSKTTNASNSETDDEDLLFKRALENGETIGIKPRYITVFESQGYNITPELLDEAERYLNALDLKSQSDLNTQFGTFINSFANKGD